MNKYLRYTNTTNMIKKILIGIVAGIISGFFASGGGMILVPAFVYFLNLDEKVARGTSILAILPMVITSSIFYFKDNYMDWKIGILCAIGGIVGGVIGAKMLKKLSNTFLRVLFVTFLLYASFKMIFM